MQDCLAVPEHFPRASFSTRKRLQVLWKSRLILVAIRNRLVVIFIIIAMAVLASLKAAGAEALQGRGTIRTAPHAALRAQDNVVAALAAREAMHIHGAGQICS